ncbi:TPA: hypothetical protein NGU80_004705 [Vibrio parahaemolyticus]|uniref:hypothetical protein n=4 Tax=Vibrio parahaemolyticus TaxID=670 RepID=UPI00042810EC|nr:hypothetical protein [Vibrio parahaemolyticus]TOL54017.1 hypothetical protein CGH95_23920 [Vibrio parahaemolyticus]HCE4735512.1 hypothetical protein [Vibrio parahaemolyticus]HCG9872170.1 hypothetical protein [Vibrio parahaemolyticus]
MDNMVLVLDESGAKGYAKNDEKFDGEVGVMAGYLYTEQEIADIERMFGQFTSPFSKSTDGKFHVTDLDELDQKKLRDAIFFAIRKTKMQWFYKAIYSKGFHQSEFKEGRGGQQDNKKLLHVELFENMLIMSLCMAHSVGKKNLKFLVKTDNIDSGTLKKFESAASFIRDIFLQNEREIFRYVNDNGKYQKEIAHTSITSDSIPKFDNISIEIECELSPLTVAADILANSVNYYLRKKQKDSLGISLNNREVIKAHPVSDLAFIAKDENHVLPLLDIVNRRE